MVERLIARPRAQLALGWCAFVIVATMYLAPPVLAGLTADDLGVTADDVSLLPTANAFTQVVLSMPTGFLLHRLGASRCIRAGVALFCVAMSGCAFASSLQQLFVLQ
eukprot:3376802-Prymnesium_polylepis.1